MSFIDSNIIHFTIILPLLAATFITLIPKTDNLSKIALSRFFALALLLVLLRIHFLLLNNRISSEYTISINLIQLTINFNLSLPSYSIFIFSAMVAALLVNNFTLSHEKINSNISYVAPFALTLILFLVLGQKDLRVALPILSIANFIIYFLISHNTKSNRGSAIFKTGIFTLIYDILALILLQNIPSGNAEEINFFWQIALLLPGLSRIVAPLTSPFIHDLFHNLEDKNGSIILVFLHCSGFFTLILASSYLTSERALFNCTIATLLTTGIIYIAFVSIFDKKIESIPAYFFTIYSSINASLLLFLKIDIAWTICSILLIISTFLYLVAKFTLQLIEERRLGSTNKKIEALWFTTSSLLHGIPGLGIGVIVWPVLYFCYQQIVLLPKKLSLWWLAILFVWIVSLVLFSLGLLRKKTSSIKFIPRTSLKLLSINGAHIIIIPAISFILTIIFALTIYFEHHQLMNWRSYDYR